MCYYSNVFTTFHCYFSKYYYYLTVIIIFILFNILQVVVLERNRRVAKECRGLLNIKKNYILCLLNIFWNCKTFVNRGLKIIYLSIHYRKCFTLAVRGLSRSTVCNSILFWLSLCTVIVQRTEPSWHFTNIESV